MTQSADRKPERYIGPDGKSKIRMVPVDREVIKGEVKKYTPPSQADIDADKKKDRKAQRAAGIKRPSMTPGSLKRRQYSGLLGKLKRESANESINEISRSMKPMSKRFGKAVDAKKFDAYKKHVKKHNVDEPSVRFIDDNPDHMQAKRAMKDKHVAQAVKLYKAAHKESTTDLAARLLKKEDSDDFTRGRARHKKQFTHASIDHKGNTVGFSRKPGGVSHAAVDKKGIAHGFANSRSDAEDLARTRNKRRPGSSSVVKLKHVTLKKPISFAQADKHLGKSLKGHYHEATIPDGQKEYHHDQPTQPAQKKKPVAELSMSMKNLTKTGLNKDASPDKDKLKKDLKNLKTKLGEKLKVSDGMGSWIKDFQGSDAPQFKGKDKEERRDMAIAAYLSAKRGDR